MVSPTLNGRGALQPAIPMVVRVERHPVLVATYLDLAAALFHPLLGAVVMLFAQALKVIGVDELLPLPAMRGLVVNDRGDFHALMPQAHLTKRLPRQLLVTQLLPQLQAVPLAPSCALWSIHTQLPGVAGDSQLITDGFKSRALHNLGYRGNFGVLFWYFSVYSNLLIYKNFI